MRLSAAAAAVSGHTTTVYSNQNGMLFFGRAIGCGLCCVFFLSLDQHDLHFDCGSCMAPSVKIYACLGVWRERDYNVARVYRLWKIINVT